jgi:hypothetical protein
MEAWGTSCPRQSIWEDAWTGGLVDVVATRDETKQLAVILTAHGKAVLDVKIKDVTGP